MNRNYEIEKKSLELFGKYASKEEKEEILKFINLGDYKKSSGKIIGIIERQIIKILAMLGDSFSEEEKKEVMIYVGACEYSLALDEIKGVIIERNKVVPPDALKEIEEMDNLFKLP